jgi:hypothetical protein
VLTSSSWVIFSPRFTNNSSLTIFHFPQSFQEVAGSPMERKNDASSAFTRDQGRRLVQGK